MEISKPTVLILVLISVLFLSALTPTIVSQVQEMNTEEGNKTAGDYGWNFTGHSGAATLWYLIPLLVIAGAVLGFVKDLI